MIELEKAQKELKDFLEKNPHIANFQKKIEKALDSVSEEKRLETITVMMTKSSMELNKALATGFKLVMEENNRLKNQTTKDIEVSDIFDKL